MKSKYYISLFLLFVCISISYAQNSYIEKFKKYVEPAMINGDTTGFPLFRAFLDSLNYKEKYQAAHDIHWDMLDTFVLKKEWEKVENTCLKFWGLFNFFWYHYFTADTLFFPYTFQHISVFDTSYSARYLTYYSMQAVIQQLTRHLMEKEYHEPGSIKVFNHKRCRESIDSIYTLVLKTYEFPDGYRRKLFGLDRFNDTELFSSGQITISREPEYKNLQFWKLYYGNTIISGSADSGISVMSKDYGKRWERHTVLSSPTARVYNTQYFDSKNGLAYYEKSSANEYCFLSTNDGGNTWNKNVLSDKIINFLIINDSTALLFSSTGGNYITKNKGFGFTAANLPFSGRNLFYLSPDIIFDIPGEDHFVQYNLQTEACRKINLPVDYKGGGGICFLDTITGFVCDAWGKVYKTSDQGKTWKRLLVPYNSEAQAIHFFNKKDGVLLGRPFYIFITHDGGETWKLDDVYVDLFKFEIGSVAFLPDYKCIITNNIPTYGFYTVDFSKAVSINFKHESKYNSIYKVFASSRNIMVKIHTTPHHNEPLIISIINTQGKKVFSKECTPREGAGVEIPLNRRVIAAGFYFVTIQSKCQKYIYPICITR